MNVKIISIITACLFILNTANALDEFEQTEMLKAHNHYRVQVGISAVNWSSKLADTAQAYANTLKDTKACNLIHSHANRLGENLFWASAKVYSSGKRKPQTITPQAVTDSWASEQHDYSYSSNSCSPGKVCGHYTQIIWQNTKEIGCAKALCDDQSQVWVCNYYPAGNYIGQKPY